jgi:hypothetical protein
MRKKFQRENHPFREKRLVSLNKAKSIAQRGIFPLISNASSYKSPRNRQPHKYPGDRADGPFMVIDDGKKGKVHLLCFSDPKDPLSGHIFIDRKFVKVNDILKEQGTPLIEEQFGVVGYGANPCPMMALEKMRQARDAGVEAPKAAVVFRGMMTDLDVAAGSFFPGGYVYGTTATSIGTGFEAWLTLYPRELLGVINDSEGLNKEPRVYEMVNGVCFRLDGQDGLIKPAAYMSAGNMFIADIDDYSGPIAFENIPATDRKFRKMGGEALIGLVLSKMAGNDRKYEINNLLSERDIEHSEGEPLEERVLKLMMHINGLGREIYARLPKIDENLVNDVALFMTEKGIPTGIFEKMKKEGNIIPVEEAYDGPKSVRFGRMLEKQ